MIHQEAVMTVLEHPDNNLLYKQLCGQRLMEEQAL